MADKPSKAEAGLLTFAQGIFGGLFDETTGGVAAANAAAPPARFGSDARSGKFAHLGEGDTPEERAKKTKAYTETRDAVRARDDAGREVLGPVVHGAGRLGGAIVQNLLLPGAGLASWGKEVAKAAVQGAAARVGEQESGEGEIATPEELAEEAVEGLVIGGAAGGLGQVIAHAPGIAGATARAAGRAVDSPVGKATKAVLDFAEDFSPVRLQVPGARLGRKAIEAGKRQVKPPAQIPASPIVGPGGQALPSATSAAEVARAAAAATRRREIADQVAGAISGSVGSQVARSGAGKPEPVSIDEIMRGVPSDGAPTLDEIMRGVP